MLISIFCISHELYFLSVRCINPFIYFDNSKLFSYAEILKFVILHQLVNDSNYSWILDFSFRQNALFLSVIIKMYQHSFLTIGTAFTISSLHHYVCNAVKWLGKENVNMRMNSEIRDNFTSFPTLFAEKLIADTHITLYIHQNGNKYFILLKCIHLNIPKVKLKYKF